MANLRIESVKRGDFIQATLTDLDLVKVVISSAPIPSLAKSTQVPEKLGNAIKRAIAECNDCILFHANEVQPVGRDKKAKCSGRRFKNSGDAPFHEVVTDDMYATATIRVVGEYNPNNPMPLFTGACGVIPAEIFAG